MTVWVDADSCPKPVREIILRAARKRKVQTIFVSDRAIPLPSSRFITTIIVEPEPDAADREIEKRAVDTDLVVTHDIPLAAKLLKSGVTAVDDRGTVFTDENIGERLAIRNLMYELRERGLQPERTKPATRKDVAAFANAFDRELSRLLKSTP